MVYYIKVNNKRIPLIFGLKSLIQLAYLIEYNEEISAKDILTLGTRVGINDLLIAPILNNQPYIEKEEISTLLSSLDFLSSDKIERLYEKSVGEMGIPPADFFSMTEEEIENAYNGYLKRKELEANLTLLAFKKAISNDDKSIKITKEENYEVGSIKERQQTFSSFNI